MLNKQGAGKIDWTDYTWNPISGCLYGCPYCYLDRIRGFDKKPAFHPERLKEIEKLKESSLIFTGSSGDMMGDWVEHEQIQAVINVMEAHPQHIFQILTKNPKRYLDFHFPKNAWLGTTVDGERNLGNASWLRHKGENNVFVSFEPLLEMLKPHLDGLDWVILGGKSGNPTFKPPPEWIEDIILEARRYGIPVFVKDNAGYPDRIKEFPDGFSRVFDEQKASRNPESFQKEEVSLCPKCNSMTHTIDGKCGKCHADKPSKRESFLREYCETCYHNKEAHTFGNCAVCNCKEFKEWKKEGKS